MENNRGSFLMTLLNCGEWDLKLIDGVGYEWDDIINEDVINELSYCHEQHGSSGINLIMRRVFDFGVDQLEEAVNDRICELEAIPNERELDADEEKELVALRSVHPQDDINYYCNAIMDTHVWFEQNKGIYQEYLQDALEAFAEGTGFDLCKE